VEELGELEEPYFGGILLQSCATYAGPDSVLLMNYDCFFYKSFLFQINPLVIKLVFTILFTILIVKVMGPSTQRVLWPLSEVRPSRGFSNVGIEFHLGLHN
jgi:hypothetical protein